MALELKTLIDPVGQVSGSRTAFGVPAAISPTNPVAGRTSTGNTSTEGIDMMTYVVLEEGLHLIVMALAVVTNSDAATSHFVRPIISNTVPTGTAGLTGLALVENNIGPEMVNMIADSNGAEIANSFGLDVKGATLGASTSVVFPVMSQLGATISLKYSHTITGACSNGGTYRISMAIIKV